MNHHALTVNVLLAIGNLISEFLLTDQGFTIRLQSDVKCLFILCYIPLRILMEYCLLAKPFHFPNKILFLLL